MPEQKQAAGIRYPQYLTDYLDRCHDFRWPTVAQAMSANVDLLALLDHLFERAMETYRMRRAIEREVKHAREELDWVSQSLEHRHFDNRHTAPVYEPRAEGDPMALGRLTRTLNDQERAVNSLCRAIEKALS